MNSLLQLSAAALVAVLLLPAQVLAQAGSAAEPSSASGSTLSGAERGRPDASVLELVKEFGGIRAVTRPSRDATMGFQLPTQLTEVLVKGGQAVKKGDPLVRGDDEEDRALTDLQRLRAETDVPIRVAAKAMELSSLEYERTREASELGGANQQELDRAKLTWERAILEHENAIQQQHQEVVGIRAREARLNKLTLRAPFDGVIDVVLTDVGQSVPENRDVLRIVNVERLWIDVDAPIDNALIMSLHDGAKAWVLFEILGKPSLRPAKVIEIAPAAHPVARTIRIRVELENPAGPARVLAGDSGWVRFSEPPSELISKMAGVP